MPRISYALWAPDRNQRKQNMNASQHFRSTYAAARDAFRAAAGARYAHLALQALVQRVEVTDHRHIAAEELAHRWPQLSPADILQSPYVLVGTVEQIVEDLQRRRERWGLSFYTVFERDMETFAPVVARLAGR